MSIAAGNELVRNVRARLPAVERRSTDRLYLEVEQVAPADWDRLVAGFDGIVQEQTAAYARSRWPRVPQETLLFRLGDEVVGGALVLLQPLPLHLATIAMCKWGPILKDAARPDAPAVYAAMIDSLVETYARRRRMLLSVLPRASTAGENWQYGHLLARRFRAGAAAQYPDRYIVDLRLPDDERRRRFAQKWRYHLNKSEKAGLSIERAGAERLAEFDVLYRAMTDRKQFPDHSAYDTIAPLFAVEPPGLRPELFFVRHEGEVVAGAVIFKAGDTAVYLFGATNDRALPLRAGYFLHWHIIRWLRDNTRARWYDLGGTEGFQGLHQFKKGMVGDAGVIAPVPPVATYAEAWWPKLVGNAALDARETVARLRRKLEARRSGKGQADGAETAAEKAD